MGLRAFLLPVLLASWLDRSMRSKASRLRFGRSGARRGSGRDEAVVPVPVPVRQGLQQQVPALHGLRAERLVDLAAVHDHHLQADALRALAPDLLLDVRELLDLRGSG